MKDRPIIGIVGRPVITREEYEAYIAYEKIRKAVIKAGGLVINILPTDLKTYSLDIEEKEGLTNEAKHNLTRIINLCDGIIFQGGSKWYSYDEFIASYVIEHDIPTLGICLGMQLLGYADTNLKPVKNETTINHEQKGVQYVHSITILKDSLLYKIIGKTRMIVNSNHKYSISETKNLQIAATSDDGIIEAIYHPNKKFILGVQFHPESMFEYDDDAFKIFLYFINKCR